MRKVHVDYQKQLAEQDEAAQAARDEIEGQLRARQRTSLEEAAQEASGRLAKSWCQRNTLMVAGFKHVLHFADHHGGGKLLSQH